LNRKKIFFVLIGVVIIIGAFFIYNNIASQSKLPPKLVLSGEEWDFGQVEANAKPTHNFILTNEGGKTLYINRVRASCGCVKTSLSTDEIPSGKSAELSVTFDTTGYEGTVSKAIYINTNDEKEPEKKIIVIINVEHLTIPKIKVSKDLWELGLISEGDVCTFKGEIENIGDADLIIDDLVIFDNIKHNFNLPLKILPHDKFEFILTYDSTGHKLGEVKESIRYNCNDPKNKTQSILISGYIKEREISGIGISPEEVTLNYDFASEEDTAGKFILKNLGNRELNIVSISSSVDYISPQYSNLKLKPKTEEELAVTISKDKAQDILEKGETIEYIYLTIALPVKISK
jgi:hypothetical protein